VRLTVVSLGVVKGTTGVTLEVTLESPAQWAVSARRGWNPGGIWPEAPRPGNQAPTLRVFDAAGKLMQPQKDGKAVGVDLNDLADFDGVTMRHNYTMHFTPDAGAPAKLVVTGPRPVVVEVPFVMENVPLP
jgi:hypothetical protein